MDKLLEIVDNLIPEDATPQVIILFIFVTLSICALFQANVIYDFIDKFNKRDIVRLRDLLADEKISKEAKKTLQRKLDSIAYQNATGITTDIYKQKEIIRYYELTEGKLTYSDFKKIKSFLELKYGILEIKNPNLFYVGLHYILWGTYIVMLLMFCSLVLYYLLYVRMSIQKEIICLIALITTFLLLMFGSLQMSIIPTVKRVNKEIENNPLILESNQANKSQQTDFTDQQLRPYGLCEGEFDVPDDFDDPLPEDVLKAFEGR